MLELLPAEAMATRARRYLTARQFGIRLRRRLYRDLAGLMKAGLSKGEALDAVRSIAAQGRRADSRTLARILADVRSRMRNGMSLGESFDGWIPGEERMLIESMEIGDRFPQQLDAFSRSLKRQAGDRGRIAGELAYPGLLVCMVYGLLVHFQLRIAPVLGDLLPRAEWTGVARHLDTASGLAASNLPAACGLALAVVPATALLLRRWAGNGPDPCRPPARVFGPSRQDRGCVPEVDGLADRGRPDRRRGDRAHQARMQPLCQAQA